MLRNILRVKETLRGGLLPSVEHLWSWAGPAALVDDSKYSDQRKSSLGIIYFSKLWVFKSQTRF